MTNETERRENSALWKENNRLLSRVRALQSKLEDAWEDNKTMRESFLRLKRRERELQGKLNSAYVRIEDLSEEVSESDDVVLRLTTGITELESELNTIKAQAGDSTEYVLAQINRELRAELTTARNELFNESLRREARIARLEKYKAFACSIMEAATENTGSCDDLEGGQIQDAAVEHGLLLPENRTVPCSENCSCEEYADEDDMVMCYRHNWKSEALPNDG